MKKLKCIYFVICMAICVIPAFLTPIFLKENTAEKRRLSEFPALIKNNKWNLSFTSEFDNWFDEHFCFRSELITANNLINSAVFSTSCEEKVIVGKSHWLYFSDTLDDYLGLNVLTSKEIDSLIVTLDLIDEYVENHNGSFVFAVAPNKNTVYPEFMPDNYRQNNAVSSLELITAALKDRPYFADVLGALRDSDEILYHKRDSHWNSLGALRGYNAILGTAGQKHDSYDNAKWHREQTWRGDLDDMIFPTLDYKDNQAVFDIDWIYKYTSSFHNEEDIFITTENSSGNGSLLVFRDSFTNAMLPFFAQTYQNAAFSRAVPRQFSLLEETHYDTVVLEIVERNLHSLLETAPIMPAPIRDIDVGQKLSGNVNINVRQYAGYAHYYGNFNINIQAEHIYLKLSGDNGVKYVEAFPIYESELLEGETSGSELSAGFSAYIPLQLSENSTVSVIVQSGNDYIELID